SHSRCYHPALPAFPTRRSSDLRFQSFLGLLLRLRAFECCHKTLELTAIDADCAVLDMAIAADRKRQFGDGDRRGVIIAAQSAEQGLDDLFIFADQRALGFALRLIAEDVERRPPEALELGKKAECRQHMRPVFLLPELARLRILLSEK